MERFGPLVLVINVTFLVEWTPERFLIPPQNLEGEKRDDWYAERAKYRWTPIGKPDKNGAIRFRCPQCDGRVKTNAKTRIRSKRSQRKAPYATTIDQEYCCKGTITIPVEKLDTYQHIPFGTPAWKKRYGRRLQIENLNSLVKNDGGLKDGWCRALGQAAHNFGLLALLIAHNLRQPNNFDHDEEEPDSEQPPTPTTSPPRPSHPIAPTGSKPETHPHNTPRDPTPTATPLSASTRPENQNPTPCNHQTAPSASPPHPQNGHHPQNPQNRPKTILNQLNRQRI